MRTLLFSRTLWTAVLLHIAPTTWGQCPNNNTVVGSVVSVSCPGSVSGGCVEGGEYVRVNVTSGNIYTFSTCGASWNTLITLYNGTGTTNLAFNDDGCNGNRSTVQWTATYTGQVRVLVDRQNCNTNGTCAPVWITCSLNDDRCTATPLTVAATCSNTTGTNNGATSTTGVASPSCSNYAGGDVWYSFLAPASGQVAITTSTVSGSSLTDGAMAVYAASTCSSAFTELDCNDDSPSGGTMPYLALSGLTSGTRYYIRFWEYGNNAFGAFNICVTTPAAAAHDDPCAGTTLTVGTSCTTTTSTTGGSTNTTGVATPSCGNYLGNDVWFRVTAPASGRIILTTSTISGSSLTNAAMALYSAASCGGAKTEIACNDNGSSGNMPQITASGLTPSTTYYVRVWANGNSTFGQFNICALEPPVNDEPCGAIAITVGSSCSMTSRTNSFATLSAGVEEPGCGTLNAGSVDVWYQFTAPTSGVAIIESTSGTLTDGSMALYSGTTCTAAGLKLVQCSADEGLGAMPFLRFTDLTPGDTYYLRYWGSGTNSGTFNLCIWSPALPSGSCVYFLELWDSGENGWGTSAVQTQVNSAAVVNTTVASSDFYECRMIGLNSGDVFQVTYVNTGGNQGQNRYQIRQVPGGWGVLRQGPNPAAGLSLVEAVDCQPPDAPIEDCRGGRSICSAESFSNSTLDTGFDMDLTARNQGCLGTAEKRGTWYHFSPSSAGTLAFTITPSANVDYDFAVWGPTTSVVCKPDQQPVRCNYAYPNGATGLSTSASNAVEDGASAQRFSSALSVSAGQVYSLYISNFSDAQPNTAFTLEWQLTGGASLDCSLLPAELLGLEAELNGDAVEVRWSTGAETNTSHFVVERSTDAMAYAEIGTVQAMGTSASLTNYFFLDERPVEGLNYYRVRQVDLDGTAENSPADHVVYRKSITDIVVFPNPAGNILWASFEMPEEDAIIWRVIDAQGRLIEQDLYHATKGNMLIDIPLERLAVGSYTLLVNDSRGLVTRSAHFVKH